MEKGDAATATAPPLAASSAATEPTPAGRPLPTAPPSYEEAIGLAAPASGIPGYPGITQAQPMAMPMPMQMPMPMPATYAPATGGQPQQSPAVGQTQMPGVRIIHQHVTVALGPNPVKMSCPACQADIKTTTMSDHQPSAHICCIILCLFGCCLCSCLPYCLSAFLSVHHFCPNCKAYIGTWKG